MSLEKSIALVTGAKSGIGKYLAEHLIRSGFKVVGASRNPSEWSLPDYLDFPTDVSDETAVRALMKFVRKLEGPLKVVINNAGFSSMNATLLTPGSSIKQMFDTNAVGTFLVSREAAKLMRRNQGGHIINISSVAVALRLEGQSAYVASKAAVEALTQVLAKEFHSMDISVNALSLPPIDTNMTRGVPKEKLQRVIQSLPIKKMGNMEEVAESVDLLINNTSESNTGQILSLGGFPES